MRIHILIIIFTLGRAAASHVPFQANSYQSLSRKSGTSPIQIDISEDDLNNFLVIGYFKLNSTPHYSSIIRVSIEEESINLLHLFANVPSSLVYAKAISNSELNYKYLMNLSSVTNPNNAWKIYGIGYKSSQNTLYLVHDYIAPTLLDPTYKLQLKTYNLPYPLISTSAEFSLCIGCSILGQLYSQMSGVYSSIKLLTGFTIQGVNTLYYNQYYMPNDLLKVSYSNNSQLLAFIETYFPSSDLECPTFGYGFFDGICLLLSNCSTLPQSQYDEIDSSNNSLFYDSSSSSCNICDGNCSLCTSSQQCVACDAGFELELITNTCLKCTSNHYYVPSTQTCEFSCPNGFYKDLSNFLCVSSFDPLVHTIGPYFNRRSFFQNTNFQIVNFSTEEIVPDCFESCIANLYSISPHMFYGGATLLSIHSIKAIFSNIPTNTYERIISFKAMITGNIVGITLSVNSVIVASSSQQMILNDVGLCGDSLLTYKIVKLTYIIFDINSSYNIKIQSSVNGWGIRDFQIQAQKCHPSCIHCYGPKAYQCWSCNKKVRKQQYQCFCEVGNYMNYNSGCYQNDCYSCSICPIGCTSCEDITGNCSSCEAGYILKDVTCILPADCTNNFIQVSSLCVLKEQVIFQHFFNNKIEQFLDYWQYQNDGITNHYSCFNMKWVVFQNGWWIRLQQTFSNYYSYNHSFKLSFNICNKDSTDQSDYLQVSDISFNWNINHSFSSGSGWSDGCGVTGFLEQISQKQVIQPKSSTSSSQYFQLQAQGHTDQPFDDEGWLIKDIQLSFLFCHPSCKECSSTSPYNCITCISNSVLLSASPFCSCAPSYYLSISQQDNRGTCKPCNSVCKTCLGESYLDCLLCSDGYLKKLGVCVSLCLPGTYWDNQTGKCQQCSSCCLECKGPLESDCFSCSPYALMTYSQGMCYFITDGSQCTSCSNFSSGNCGGTGTQINVNFCSSLEWFQLNSSSCAQCKFYYEACGGHSFENICNDLGYLYNPEDNLCFPCSLADLQNCGVEKIQAGCIQNGWVFYQSSTCIKCNSSYQDPACSLCHSSCLTCSGPSEVQCITCFSNFYYFQGYCLSACPNGYLLDTLSSSCNQCLFLSSPGCQSCYPTCKICSPLQISINSNTCTSCYPSRILQNGRCNCKDAEDDRVTYYECSYKNQAVLDILLSSNSPTMMIEFGKFLQDLNNFQGQNSNEVCVAIFDQSSLDLLGFGPICTISGSKIIIILGTDADIFDGDIVILLPNVLMFKTETVYINTFFNYVVVQQLPLNLQIGFSYNKIADSCKDFNVYLKNLSGDSSRGFKTILWSLVNPDSTNLEDVALQTIFASASTNKLSTLTIPKGTVTVEVFKTIQLDIVMKNTYTSSQQFVFQFSKKSISSVVTKSELTPFYRFNQLDLSLSWELKYCDSNGIPTYFSEDVNFSITSVQMASLTINENNYPQKNFIDSIQPYTFIPLETYQFQVISISFFKSQNFLNQFKVIMGSDSNIFTEDSLELFITPSPLIVQIIGGSKQIDYRKSQTFKSYLRDRDFQDPTMDQGIMPTWNCVDPVTQSQCISISGALVSFIAAPTATIQAGTFPPYSFVVLHLSGSKDTRISQAQCNVVFSEFDLPNLNISLQMIDPQQETINLNEEVLVQLEYGQNVNTDILSYSGTIVYKLDSVGVIQFDFMTFRFKLWNIFSDFKRSSPFFSLRFSVYNPNYFMPSSTILQFKLNFPPDQCTLHVTPNESGNTSIQTLFSLEMTGCIDEDIPIQYQFFYYTNLSEMDQEIANPTIVRRKQITDLSKESKISTILPSGNIILLATAVDKKQAISNCTQGVPVLKQSVTESSYSNLVNSYLDSNNKTLSTYISQLSIVSQDLSTMTSFTSAAINDQKKKIISSLQKAASNLTISSQYEDVINKSISSLILSGISYSQAEQQNQIKGMFDTLGQPLPTTFTSLKKEQRQQQLYDFYQSVDGMAINYDLSASAEMSKMQLNLTERISDILTQYSLPNENKISFSGNSVQIATQKITTKYLCAYYRCNETAFQNSQDDSIPPNIYSMSTVQYQDNPFNSDTSFQNYSTYLKNYTNETLTKYPFVLPLVKDSNSLLVSINKEINVEFKSQGNKTNGLSCIAKPSNSGWSLDICKNIYSSKYNSFTCVCNSPNPTTIVDDIESLIANKNLQTAFSSQGINNISSWTNFYEYVAFWLILSETGIFIYLLFQGHRLDELEKQKLKVANSVQITPFIGQDILLNNNNLAKKKAINQVEGEDNQINKGEKLMIEELDSEYCNQNVEVLSQKQQSNIQISPMVSSYQKNDSNIQDMANNKKVLRQSSEFQMNIEIEKNILPRESVSIIIQKPTNSIEVIPKKQSGLKRSRQYQFKIDEKDFHSFQKVKLIKQILLFHNFFNIFLIFDSKLSRQLRFSFFYVRLVHSLAISVVYDQQYTQIQMIAISIFNAIIVTIILKLLEFLANFRSFGKKLATLFLISLLLFYYYLILSIVSGQQSSSSNKALTSFIVVFISDLIVIATITAIAMKFLAKYVLKNLGSMKYSKQIIEFLKLQMILQIINKL